MPDNISHISDQITDSRSEKPVITDDWTNNWQASIAVKITAVVMWVIIPFGFVIALMLVNNIKNDISVAVDADADVLLNSARILLSDNNSYNSSRTIKVLKKQLEKSVYCKIRLSMADAEPVIIRTQDCQQDTKTLDKKYFFSTVTANKPQELALILSHQPVQDMMIIHRSNIIVIMIIIVIILGLVLTSVIRLFVLKPLLNMVEATQLISEGKHDLRLSLNQLDEFGYLAKFLNKMLDQVFEQQKNLKHANLELMKEVAERNRIALELRANRDQLEKLVDERTEDLAIARDDALEANKAKSLFLANMSHEIRTPLNAILGYSQLLHRESGFTEKQLKSLKIIEESGNHLLGLLNDILDISKIEAGKMELNTINFDLNGLLHGLSQVFQERCSDKGLVWHNQFEIDEQILVHSDPQKIRQVLINLIGNSIKFTEQGDISLRVKNTSDDNYLFEVSDTGPGIEKEQINEILKPFHQEQSGIMKGGTGLGLAITKKQLQLLEAELNVSSIVGEGSVFSFGLKLKSAKGGFEVRQDKGVEVIRLASSDSVKALVVDDIELSRNLLVDMLAEIDAEVGSASNGLEAIEYLESATPANMPNIVFMDIRMPVMNGVEAVKQIKKIYGDAIVCVAVTASTMDNPDEKYFQVGFDDYISKPYRFEAVFECMKKHLQINFEHENIPQIEKSGGIKIDFSKFKVDKIMRDNLLEASKSYALTNLKALLTELATYGEEEKNASHKLTRLMEQYDMQGMVTLIEQFKYNNE